jgi:hypothetical protein
MLDHGNSESLRIQSFRSARSFKQKNPCKCRAYLLEVFRRIKEIVRGALQ